MSRLPSARYVSLGSTSQTSTAEYQPVKTAKASRAPWPHVRLAQGIRKYYRKLARPWWAWEIFAAIISMIATISLVIALSQAEKAQQQQQSWAIGGTLLTINTIVAGIGTVLRTTLLLAVAGALNQSAWNWFASSIGRSESDGQPLKDLETFSDASANSWNCIKLLWRTKCRYLVSIGAFVMILSLAFDAFLQQILSTEQQSQPTTLTGPNLTAQNVLPRSATHHYDSDGMELIHWQSTMFSAVAQITGLLPNVVCPTGYCTWPITPSLATCHECKSVDFTALQRSEGNCNITTYSQPYMADRSITTTQCKNGTGKAKWEMVSDPQINVPPVAMNSANITIIKLYSLGITSSRNVKKGLPWDAVAYECSIRFCIKGYTGFVYNGLPNMSTIEDIGHEAQFITNHTDGEAWKFVNIPASLNTTESNLITVDEKFRSMLNGLAQTVLTGTTRMKAEGSGDGSSDFSWTDSSYPIAVLHYSSDNLENFTATIGRVSDGMTNRIRTTAHEKPKSIYAPSVTISVPTILVQWPWLAYVLVLQFSGLLFLLLTIQATNRRRIHAWKGHRMAFLLAELDSSLQHKAQGGLSHRTGLDDRIGEIKVRLEYNGDDRIAFRRVEQELSHRRTVVSEFESANEMVL